MSPNQSLAQLTARLVSKVSKFLEPDKPDLVIVHGDATTAMRAALAAFYLGIPVAHVEAGLRTGDQRSPLPEEVNRVLVGRLADLPFAPTRLSAHHE